MTYILPIFCSAICSVFTLLLIWNYRNLAERKLRRVVSIYCILIAIWWSSALWHVLSDDPIFLPVDIPFALSYIYIPVLFYNIVYYLAYLGKKKNFPVLNYLWPVPTLVIVLITVASREDFLPDSHYLSDIRSFLYPVFYYGLSQRWPILFRPACYCCGIIGRRYFKRSIRIENISV